MDTDATAECPFCFDRMEREERDGTTWLVCPNGCPTEYEEIPRKPPRNESEAETPGEQTRSVGA